MGRSEEGIVAGRIIPSSEQNNACCTCPAASRLLAITAVLALMLLIYASSSVCIYAGDMGEDAHSDTMSAGAGDEDYSEEDQGLLGLDLSGLADYTPVVIAGGAAAIVLIIIVVLIRKARSDADYERGRHYPGRHSRE